MTAGCDSNPGMAAVKKADETKYKAICTACGKMAASSKPARTIT